MRNGEASRGYRIEFIKQVLPMLFNPTGLLEFEAGFNVSS